MGLRLMHKDDETGGTPGANWDDLRFVLAVAEAGSVSAAARALGVNHATVLRRIAAFEGAHGSSVFDRTPQGYVIPPDRLRVIEAAREAAAAVAAAGEMLRGARASGPAVVRVTTTDTFCLTVLPGILAQVRAEMPDLRVDLICSNAHLDLGRLSADLAVRPAQQLPPDLSGEAAGALGFGAYRRAGAGGDVPWLGLQGLLGRTPPARWIAESGQPQAGFGADSFPVLREMAAAGLGRAFLPRCLGDGDARLVADPGPTPAMSVPIWVASHADLGDAVRLRRLRRRLAEGLRDLAPVLDPAGAAAAQRSEGVSWSGGAVSR